MAEDKIFESSDKVGASDNLMSFDSCPNRCRNGHYIDPYLHKRVRCQYCLDLRKKLIKDSIQLDSGKSISEALRLPPMFTGYGNFDIDTIFVKTELSKMEDWSVDFVKAVLQALIERVSLGEPVMSSLLINVGRRAHTQQFIAPFLARSYVSGLTTAPMLRSLDVVRLRASGYGEMPKGWRTSYGDLEYDSLLESDTCLVYLDAGAGSEDERELLAVKGLMQLRAWNGKSTIILADYYNMLKFRDMTTDFGLMSELRDVSTNTAKQSADAVKAMIDGTASYERDLALYVTVHYKKGIKQEEPVVRRGSEFSKHEAQLLMAQNSTVGIR